MASSPVSVPRGSQPGAVMPSNEEVEALALFITSAHSISKTGSQGQSTDSEGAQSAANEKPTPKLRKSQSASELFVSESSLTPSVEDGMSSSQPDSSSAGRPRRGRPPKTGVVSVSTPSSPTKKEPHIPLAAQFAAATAAAAAAATSPTPSSPPRRRVTGRKRKRTDSEEDDNAGGDDSTSTRPAKDAKLTDDAAQSLMRGTQLVVLEGGMGSSVAHDMLLVNPANHKETALAILTQLQKTVQLLAAKLDAMKEQQKLILHQGGDSSALSMLLTRYKEISGQLEQISTVCHNIHATRVLSVQELFLYQDIQLTLPMLDKQHELLVSEARHFEHPNVFERQWAALVIAKQQFPQTVRQNKPLAGNVPIIVKLLADSCAEFAGLSQVRANLSMHDEKQKRKFMGELLKNDVQDLDLRTGTAEFNLSFVQGTRMSRATVKFSMDVQLKTGKTVTSRSLKVHSEPFIVITNESQWDESEGALIALSAFGDKTTCEWPHLCNILQEHVVQELRNNGDPSRPFRAMSKSDLDYFHRLFFAGKNQVSLTEYTKFWEWFGKAFQVLRFQKHINTLWQLGMVYGFMSREDATLIVKDMDPGTFIIIFADKYPGQLAIAYVSPKTRTVRHYLIGHYDTGAKKALPAFLFEHPPLSHVAQFTHEVDHRGVPKFTVISKIDAFGKFCPPTHYAKELTDSELYDPIIA